MIILKIKLSIFLNFISHVFKMKLRINLLDTQKQKE